MSEKTFVNEKKYAGKAKEIVLNQYHIETKDGAGSFNFFTQAENHKKALRRLQTDSFDYKRLVKNNVDLTITVKQV